MSNKSSQLDYIPTSLLKSCADTFSLLISHLANLSFSQATFPTNFKLALISPLLKNLVCQNLILPISGPFLILIQLAKFWNDLLLHAFSPTYLFLPVSVLFSLRTANSTLLKQLCSNLQTTSWKISTLGRLLFSLLLIRRQLLILLTTPHSFTGLNIHLVYPVLSSLGLNHICFLAHLLLKLIRRHRPLPPYSQVYLRALFWVHFFLFFLSRRLQTSLILARPVTIWFLSINTLTTPNFILAQTRLLSYLRLLPSNHAP